MTNAPPSPKLKDRIFHFYERHEVKFDTAFFLGGFVFDIFTLSDIDDSFSILQQLLYLVLIGLGLYLEFLVSARPPENPLHPPRWLKWPWQYRDLALHFLLGSLLSVYSLFFFKSASFFTSAVFLCLLATIMVLNEMKRVQGGGPAVKVALVTLCLFCFFSIIFPIVLGFIGLLPFLLAVIATVIVIYLLRRFLRRKVPEFYVSKQLIRPSFGVLTILCIFYLLHWIPPVPLSIAKMGVYHNVEKVDGKYRLEHENPWWKFWRSGDQNFLAAPGEKIFFFVSVFSPARFEDSVVLHWSYKDPRQGWISSDHIPMKVAGGRKGGYRGFTIKQNFTDGDWRVAVETTDGREIGRLYFTVKKVAEAPNGRIFYAELY